MKTPLIIFAYNRPDNLGKVLESVKSRYRGKVIFIIDGPKEGQSKEAIDECVRIAEAADMPDKELIIHKSNRGLPGMSDDMDTISAEYERFMVLEDDCLPMPGFFDYVEKALDFYDAHEEVFAIGGYQLLPNKYFRNYNYSVMSTNRFMCWGWATWSNKWKEVRDARMNYASLFENLTKIPDIAGIDLREGAVAVKEGRIKTWDIQVSLAMLYHEKIMIIPVNGLIKNIGLEKGTHGAGDYHPYHNLNINQKDINNKSFIIDTSPGELNGKLIGYIRKVTNPNIINKLTIKIKKKSGLLRNFGQRFFTI